MSSRVATCVVVQIRVKATVVTARDVFVVAVIAMDVMVAMFVELAVIFDNLLLRKAMDSTQQFLLQILRLVSTVISIVILVSYMKA